MNQYVVPELLPTGKGDPNKPVIRTLPPEEIGIMRLNPKDWMGKTQTNRGAQVLTVWVVTELTVCQPL